MAIAYEKEGQIPPVDRFVNALTPTVVCYRQVEGVPAVESIFVARRHGSPSAVRIRNDCPHWIESMIEYALCNTYEKGVRV